MPEHEIPTLDEILNEPIVEKRINSLIAIAYTNYNSINNLNERLEDICSGSRRRRVEQGGIWVGLGTAAAAFITALWTTFNKP